VQKIRNWMASATNATQVEKLREAYKSQHQIGSFFGYVFSQYKKGNVTIA